MLKISGLSIHREGFRLESRDPLCFYPGEMTFIKGESGSGKTTLLYILGLISEHRHYVYRLNGKKMANGSLRDQIKKREIGFIYQNFNIIDSMSLYENLSLFASLAGKTMAVKKARRVLRLVGLDMVTSRYAHTLSGGEKQRFCLACVLAKDPLVILADEPTSALDDENANMMMAILAKLARDKGKIVIVSTHTQAYDDLASRIYQIHSGEIRLVKTVPEHPLSKSRKLRQSHVPLSFYRQLSFHYIRRSFLRHGWLMLATILLLSLSIFLVRYNDISNREYETMLSNAIQDEVIVLTDTLMPEAIDAEIEQMAEVAGVQDVEKILVLDGTLALPDGTIQDVQIYPIYPFQVGSDEAEGIYADSTLLAYVDETIQVNIDGASHSYILKDVLGMNRTSMYDDQSGRCILYLPSSIFPDDQATFTSKYVVDINNIEQYDLIKEDLTKINPHFTMTNTFQDVATLQSSMASNQLYGYMAFMIMNILTFILLAYMAYHEYLDKHRELCVYQANGLSRKDLIVLEVGEWILKLLINFVLTFAVICLLMMVGNHFFLKYFTLQLDVSFIRLGILLLVIDILLPGIVFFIPILKMPIEEELRANTN